LDKIAEKFSQYLDNLGNSFSAEAENKKKDKANPSNFYFLILNFFIKNLF
jgi:hypothetical protein